MICSSQLLSSPILILQTNNTSIRLQAYLFFLRQDLNRIKKKPYTETVDSDGRSDEVSRMKKHAGLNVTLCFILLYFLASGWWLSHSLFSLVLMYWYNDLWAGCSCKSWSYCDQVTWLTGICDSEWLGFANKAQSFYDSVLLFCNGLFVDCSRWSLGDLQEEKWFLYCGSVPRAV